MDSVLGISNFSNGWSTNPKIWTEDITWNSCFWQAGHNALAVAMEDYETESDGYAITGGGWVIPPKKNSKNEADQYVQMLQK